jgi:hypothetical protein
VVTLVRVVSPVGEDPVVLGHCGGKYRIEVVEADIALGAARFQCGGELPGDLLGRNVAL